MICSQPNHPLLTTQVVVAKIEDPISLKWTPAEELIRIECSIDAHLNGSHYNWKWLKDGSEVDKTRITIHSSVDSMTSAIEFYRAYDNHTDLNGNFQCTATTDKLTVLPLYKNLTRNFNIDYIDFVYGNESVLDCSEIGNNHEISYFKYNPDLLNVTPMEHSNLTIINKHNGTITIRDLDHEDPTHDYGCESLPNKMVKYFLSRIVPTFEVGKTSIRTKENKEVELQCQVSFGHINSTNYKWKWTFLHDRIHHMEITDASDNFNVSSDYRTSNLTIRDVKSHELGNYTCQYSNSYGTTSKIITVELKDLSNLKWPYILGAVIVIVGCAVVFVIERASKKRSYKNREHDLSAAMLKERIVYA